MTHAYNHIYGYLIKVHAGIYPNTDIVESLKWDGMRFDQFVKWQWYFEYRYALLRVKYPKNHIDARTFSMPLTQNDTAELLKSKISAQKGKITRYKSKLLLYINKFNEFKESYCKIFPMEDDWDFKVFIANITAAEEKIGKAIRKLGHLEDELKINN